MRARRTCQTQEASPIGVSRRIIHCRWIPLADAQPDRSHTHHLTWLLPRPTCFSSPFFSLFPHFVSVMLYCYGMNVCLGLYWETNGRRSWCSHLFCPWVVLFFSGMFLFSADLFPCPLDTLVLPISVPCPVAQDQVIDGSWFTPDSTL